VVTGPSSGGKTETVRAVAERLGSTGVPIAGFVQPGEFAEGRKVGFRLCDVATGEEAALATLGERREGDFGTRFQFADEGFRLGREALSRASSGAVVIIDELGPVELRGQGHMPAVRDALAVAGLRGAIVVVRRALVPTLLAELEASDAIVVDVEAEGDRAVQAIVGALAIER
jgi:nucleoside-triphosphatase THEP1